MIEASSSLPSNVPFIGLPGTNGPSSVKPNQAPNSFASEIARHTRESGAFSVTCFSILSVLLMCNLLVADIAPAQATRNRFVARPKGPRWRPGLVESILMVTEHGPRAHSL